MTGPRPTPDDHVTMSRSTLRRLGIASWLWLGILLFSAVIYAGLVHLSGLVVPLILAAVIGILFVPLVDLLEKYMSRVLASWLVLVGAIALVVATAWLTIDGIIDQLPQIEAQITAGLQELGDFFADLGFSGSDLVEGLDDLENLVNHVGVGLAALLGSAFSSLAAFAAGIFASLFLLYFILQDWDLLSRWSARHLGVEPGLGEGIIDDAIWAMRGYFYVLTMSSLVGGIFVGVTMSALGLPLAFTVGLVTFMTSYIPYLGAIFSGAFAFLVALGAGGMPAALLILLVIIVAQTIVQPLIQVRITERSLELHPIVTFASTIVGSAIAGLLGATLSAPIVAMVVKVRKRVLEQRPDRQEGQERSCNLAGKHPGSSNHAIDTPNSPARPHLCDGRGLCRAPRPGGHHGRPRNQHCFGNDDRGGNDDRVRWHCCPGRHRNLGLRQRRR